MLPIKETFASVQGEGYYAGCWPNNSIIIARMRSGNIAVAKCIYPTHGTQFVRPKSDVMCLINRHLRRSDLSSFDCRNVLLPKSKNTFRAVRQSKL